MPSRLKVLCMTALPDLLVDGNGLRVASWCSLTPVADEGDVFGRCLKAQPV